MLPSPKLRLPRRAAVVALALFVSLLSCGREITGPGGRGALAQLSFAPNYSSMIDEVDGVMHSVSALLPFNRVRIELRRVDNSIAAAEVVEFPQTASEVPLSIRVRLGPAADRDGETLTAFLRYINAAGDTVFAGGPISVRAISGEDGETQQPVEIPIAPTAPGAVFARLELAPDSLVDTTGKTRTFTAVGYDAQNNVVPNAIIGFISRNPAIVAVPTLGSGTVNLVGVRGSTWLIAQSLTGVKDSSRVRVLPKPTQLVKVSGDNQSGLENASFAQPLRVRALAADGLGVANWTVHFAVTTGGGTVSAATVSTDSAGFAEVTWTAGTALGVATVTASTASPTLSAVFAGQQLSAMPTSLAFLTQPNNITAGGALPGLQVAVRNGAGATMPAFTGAVTVTLSGGTAGAALVGTTTVNAVAGVATFSGLTVNRGGAGYRVEATLAAVPPVQSNPFDVAAAPPFAINMLAGAGQVAPPSTVLTDSIRVRVVDQFGFAVAGQTLQFTVTQGGGSASSTTRTTDGDGRAAVTWTLGAAGVQQLRVSVGALETFVTAGIVVAGPVQLVAGYDYTTARIGANKAIPIFLTNPSATPVAVTLEVNAAGSAYLAWTSPSVTINPGITRVDALVTGLAQGNAWAIMRSAVGDDSVLVSVDSAFLELTSLSDYYFMVGDTIRTFVKLSEPAPAGGITVVLRSSDGTLAKLAPSSGRGTPAGGCIASLCGGGGAVMAGLMEAPGSAAETVPLGPSRLLAAPADTAVVFIPEGQLFGEFAILLLDDNGGCANVDVQADAPNFAGGSMSVLVVQQYVLPYLQASNDPGRGIGVGQMTSLNFYTQVRRSREQRVYLRSTDTLRVQVDSFTIVPAGETYAIRTWLRAVGLDTAYVRYWTDGSPVDSMLVVGSVPRVRLQGGTTAEGGAEEASVSVASVLNPLNSFPRWTDLPITVVTGDPAVAVPEQATVILRAGDSFQEVDIRGIALGASFMSAGAPGHTADTIFYNTFRPAVQFSSYSPSLGVDQLYDHYLFLNQRAYRAGARTINVTSLSPGVVQVMTPTVELSAGSGGGTTVRLRGVGTGAGTVQFSGPGIQTTNLSVSVNPTTLQLFAPSTLTADGLPRNITTAIRGGGATRPLADSALAILRSSNPSVLAVTDSIIVFPALGSAFQYTGHIRPLVPGTATLRLVRPGVDSVSQAVTVTPYQLSTFNGLTAIAQQMQGDIIVYREGPDTLALPISITQSGPGHVSFSMQPSQFAVGDDDAHFQFVGEVLGVDTLTYTVPGYPSITHVVTVHPTQATATLGGRQAYVGAVYPYVSSDITSCCSGYFTPGKTIRLSVVSLDTARVQVVQDTIEWSVGVPYEPTRTATLRFKQAGPASITLVDLDGVITSDTTEILVEPGSLSGNYNYYGSGEGFSLAMNQRTDPFERSIRRGMVSTEPLWVRLESSNPAVVQVPDSIMIAADDEEASYIVTAGDTTGSAQITASAFGYNPYFVDVLVTRGRFETYASNASLDGKGFADVYVVDALTGTTRPHNVNVNARLTTSTPTLLDSTGSQPFTIPAGLYSQRVRGLQGLTVGTGTLQVKDEGAIRFDSIAAGSNVVDVYAPSVTSNVRRFRLTPDLVSETYSSSVNIITARDTAFVTLEALGAHFAPVLDTIVVEANGIFNSSSYLTLRGISLGRDTLTIAMLGARTDTVVVDVEPGFLSVQNQVGGTLIEGDSVLITLRVQDASGDLATAVADITFTASVSDTSFVLVEGGAVVSNATLHTGETTMHFWVRAESAATSTLTLSHPNFRPFTLRLNSVFRP